MNPFLKQLLEPSTYIPLGTVLSLGFAACFAAWRDKVVLCHQIEENGRDFEAALSAAEQEGPRALGAHRLLLPVVAVLESRLEDEESPPARWLVRADVPDAYAEACTEALGSRSPASRFLNATGHSLTGIALVFTFGFIAYVLAKDVPLAIQNVAGDATAAPEVNAALQRLGNDALQRAVGLIGAKFTVSAAGLLFSLVFRVVEGWARSAIYEAARQLGHANRTLFVSQEAHRFSVVRDSLAAIRAESAEGTAKQTQALVAALVAVQRQVHQGDTQLVASLGAVKQQVQEGDTAVVAALAGLSSIEVSVKAMGAEVTAHLGSILKQHVADQICDALADLRAFAQEQTENLAKAFGAITAEENAKLRESMDGVQRTIAEQSKSDVGKLVEQMRDMMSGGFQSESQNMTSAMAALRDVLPKLEEQMRRMTEDVDREMRERGEVSGRMQSELLQQLERALATSQSSQQESQAALQRLLSATEQSAGALQARIVGTGEEMVGRLMGASSQGLADVRAKLEAIGEATNGTAAEFLREVSAAKRSLEESRTALTDNVNAVRELAKELRTTLGGTNTALQHSSTALAKFDGASGAVGQASLRIDGAISSFAKWMDNEKALLAQQRELAEKVLPGLMNQYIGQLDEQASRLRNTWSQLASEVERTVKGASSELTENVESLVEQVEKLHTTLERARVTVR